MTTLRFRVAVISIMTAAFAACERQPTIPDIPATGSLALTITGLPDGVDAAVTVAGVAGFTRNATASTTLPGLVPGTYTVSAMAVEAPDETGFAPAPSVQSVVVSAEESTEAEVAYSVSTGSLLVTIAGLPDGMDARVTVTGPEGFTRSLTTTMLVSGLTPGTYALEAAPVVIHDGSYLSEPESQTVAVVIAATSQVGLEYAFAPAPPRSLDWIVDSVRVAFDLPALAAAIVTSNNRSFAQGVAGTRRGTGGLAVTVDDLWHLGSNFKAFTGTLAAVAVDRGDLSLTTTLSQSFPELAETMLPEYHDVTLRQLLSHQSGVPRDPPHAIATDGATRSEQRTSVVNWTVTQPPVSAINTFYYTNTGYMLAAAMAERALGKDFEEAMRSLVFDPLDIADGGFGPQAPAGTSTQPVAHRRVDGEWQELEEFDNPPVYSSAGGAHMSIGSWAAFIQEVLQIELGTPRIVSVGEGRETTASIATVSANDSYGLGWFITSRDWASGRTLTHNGFNTANHSIAWVAPLRGFAVLVVTNSYDGTESALTWRALDVLAGRLIEYYTHGQ